MKKRREENWPNKNEGSQGRRSGSPRGSGKFPPGKGTMPPIAPARAVRARYDARRKRVCIQFSSGLEAAFSAREAQGLQRATAAQLKKIKISPSGFGLQFPKIDVELYLPALLMGFLGSRNWMAARLGALGGKSRSAAKIAAAKRNGRRGGRPGKGA
jgi:hypothetical protein